MDPTPTNNGPEVRVPTVLNLLGNSRN